MSRYDFTHNLLVSSERQIKSLKMRTAPFQEVPLFEILSVAHAFFFMSQSAMSTAAIASAASRTGIDEP